MKIYMTDIVPFGDEKIFAQMLPFITEDRKNKIMQLKKKEDRCRSLAAGLLLEYALREYGISLLPGKMQQMYLRFGEKGKPVLNGKTGIHFNLSHSGRYVAGVFSDEEVGIDVEQIRKGQMKVAERFFCPEEYLALQKGKMKKADCYFTELWTRKESYIKAVGKGMALDLASFCVVHVRWSDCIVQCNCKLKRGKFLSFFSLSCDRMLFPCCWGMGCTVYSWIFAVNKERNWCENKIFTRRNGEFI